MAGHRAKRIEIWASGMSIQCIHSILVKLNASGVTRRISDFQTPCASKTAGLRMKNTSRSLLSSFMWSLSSILSSRGPSPWASCLIFFLSGLCWDNMVLHKIDFALVSDGKHTTSNQKETLFCVPFKNPVF